MKPIKWAQCVGSTHEDLAIVAGRLVRHLVQGDATLWIEDDGKVYCAQPEVVAGIPTHWIAGTYQLGQLTELIVDDLRALVAERAKSWIIE